jgi:hypothetical protein
MCFATLKSRNISWGILYNTHILVHTDTLLGELSLDMPA